MLTVVQTLFAFAAWTTPAVVCLVLLSTLFGGTRRQFSGE